MNRDQKIGLSLGILLVGAVAAFFYRHEQPRAVPLPELQSAAELDAQIAERPHAPYLESNVPAKAEPLPPAVSTDDSDLAQHGLVPEPIALETALKQHGISPTSLSNAAQARRPAAPVASVHVVRSGDTLSSIAAQYLGSAARFNELYEANRDRLRDANDLRVGQELRLPGAVSSGASTSMEPVEVQPVEPTLSPAAPPAKMFQPFPGNRGLPRTGVPTNLDASSPSGKRLSQMPPPEDLIIRR